MYATLDGLMPFVRAGDPRVGLLSVLVKDFADVRDWTPMLEGAWAGLGVLKALSPPGAPVHRYYTILELLDSVAQPGAATGAVAERRVREIAAARLAAGVGDLGPT